MAVINRVVRSSASWFGGEMAPVMISFLRVAAVLLVVYAAVGAGVFFMQRSLLFHPTRHRVESVMVPWRVHGEIIGMKREVKNPTAIWLILHGNGGQAAHRDYLLEQVAADTAVYVLEYPGYGDRPGLASADNFNAAAREAYAVLGERYPDLPVGLIGESIGSGPASLLSASMPPPAKVVLLVPFDELHRVAGARFPWLPVTWLMRDQWNNVAALRNYAGPVEVYAAQEDEIIPFRHAQALAAALPRARLIAMAGGHNSWQWSRSSPCPRKHPLPMLPLPPLITKHPEISPCLKSVIFPRPNSNWRYPICKRPRRWQAVWK